MDIAQRATSIRWLSVKAERPITWQCPSRDQVMGASLDGGGGPAQGGVAAPRQYVHDSITSSRLRSTVAFGQKQDFKTPHVRGFMGTLQKSTALPVSAAGEPSQVNRCGIKFPSRTLCHHITSKSISLYQVIHQFNKFKSALKLFPPLSPSFRSVVVRWVGTSFSPRSWKKKPRRSFPNLHLLITAELDFTMEKKTFVYNTEFISLYCTNLQCITSRSI